MNNDRISFKDSLSFGKEGENILKKYLLKELEEQHKNKAFNFEDVTQNRICQFAGLDFAIKKNLKVDSLHNLALAIIDGIEIKSHLWTNFDLHKADLVFEVYSDYNRKIKGWTDKMILTIEKNILPFIRIFWINKSDFWVDSIQLNKRFIEFWRTDPWEKDHRLNTPSYHNGRTWQSSFSPIKVLSLQREGIPFTRFQISNI